jgi:hypothetical protein
MTPDGPRDYARDLEALLSQTEERAERIESLKAQKSQRRIVRIMTAIEGKWGRTEPPAWVVPRLSTLFQTTDTESAIKTLIEEIETA